MVICKRGENMLGKNLELYRKANGLSQRKLAEMLNVSNTTISKYEKDELIPNSQILIQISEILNVKLNDLVKTFDDTFEISTPFFRKKRVSKKAIDYLHNKISSEVRDYLSLLRLDKRETETYEYSRFNWKNYDDYNESAAFVRTQLKLDIKEPIHDLTYHLENSGFVVLQSNYPSFFDGAVTYVNGFKSPFIILNESLKADRYRFTLSHELGHHFIDFDNVGYDEKEIEKSIHMFTAAFLLPDEDMFNYFGNHRTKLSLDELGIIKVKYKVSLQAIVMRINDLNIISNDYKQDIFKFFSKNNMRIEEPYPLEKEKPTRKTSLVYYLYLQDIISLNRAAESLNVPIEDIRESAILA